MAKTIEVLITPNGDTQITTKGFRGAECKKATEDLERALGTVTADTPTAEMKQTTVKQNVDTSRKV